MRQRKDAAESTEDRLFAVKFPKIVLSRWFGLIAVGLVPLALYLKTLTYGFVFDDIPGIVNSARISAPTNFSETWSVLGEPWRPVVYFSYAITHLRFGFNSWAFHGGNIFIHLINCILVYGIASLVASIWLSPKRAPVFALGAALIFASHPLQSEAVAYVWGRSSSLCGTFYFGSILFVLLGYRDRAERKQVFWFVMAVAAGLLAWRSKEDAITLPLVISGFFLLTGWRTAAVSSFLIPITIMAARLSDMASLYQLVAAQNQDLILAGANHTLDTGTYIATGIKSTVFYYLSKFLLPVNQNVDPSITPVTTPLNALFILSVMILVFLAVISFWARKKHPLLSFGLIALLVSPILSYAVIPLADVVAEHRAYISGFGVAIIAAWVLTLKPGIARISLPILVILCCGATFQRNSAWKDSVTLWEDSAAKAPLLARPHLNLGVAYQSLGRYEEALRQYNKALESNPRLSLAYSNIGSIYTIKSDMRTAEYAYNKAIEVSPKRISPYLSLAEIAIAEKEPSKALGVLEKAQSLGDSPMVSFYQGEAFLNLGRCDQATKAYQKASEQLGSGPSELLQRIRTRMQQIGKFSCKE